MATTLLARRSFLQIAVGAGLAAAGINALRKQAAAESSA